MTGEMREQGQSEKNLLTVPVRPDRFCNGLVFPPAENVSVIMLVRTLLCFIRTDAAVRKEDTQAHTQNTENRVFNTGCVTAPRPSPQGLRRLNEITPKRAKYLVAIR